MPDLTQSITVDTKYVFDRALAANEVALQLRQEFDNDSDFLLRAIAIMSLDTFQVRFNDGAGYYFSTDFMNGNFFRAWVGLETPFVLTPQAAFKAGSYIGIDLQDTSGNPNKIQIIFYGARLYYPMEKAIAKAVEHN